MSNSIYPKARKDKLVTSKVSDETIVYDTETNKASCLNGLTTVVWEACDGKTDIKSLLDTARSAGYQEANEQVILMAVDQLDQAELLDEFYETDDKVRKKLNRREMLRVLGMGGAAVLPVVSTISVHPAAMAASTCLPKHAPCDEDSQCCSNHCVGWGKCE